MKTLNKILDVKEECIHTGQVVHQVLKGKDLRPSICMAVVNVHGIM